MKQLIVAKTNLYASGLTGAGVQVGYLPFAGTDASVLLPTLAVGAIAFVDMDPASANYGRVMDISHTTAPSASTLARLFAIYANVGTGTTVATGARLIKTPVIDKTRAAMVKTSYAAAAAKVWRIGSLINGVTLTVKDSPGVTITDKSGSQIKLRTYTADASTVALTGAQAAAAVIAKINADPFACVTAALYSTDGITFTGKTAGADYDVSRIGVAFTSAPSTGVTVTTAYNPGVGTPATLAATEVDSMVRDNMSNANGVNSIVMWTPAKQIDSTKTYDIYSLVFDATSQRPLAQQDKLDVEITFAVDTSLTAAANWNIKQAMSTLLACFPSQG